MRFWVEFGEKTKDIVNKNQDLGSIHLQSIFIEFSNLVTIKNCTMTYRYTCLRNFGSSKRTLPLLMLKMPTRRLSTCLGARCLSSPQRFPEHYVYVCVCMSAKRAFGGRRGGGVEGGRVGGGSMHVYLMYACTYMIYVYIHPHAPTCTPKHAHTHA